MSASKLDGEFERRLKRDHLTSLETCKYSTSKIVADLAIYRTKVLQETTVFAGIQCP